MSQKRGSSEALNAINWQKEIYINGVSGKRLDIPSEMDRLEHNASKVMSKEAFAYVAGGAGLGKTMDANRQAFGHWKIVPRMLKDVSERDISIELFGRKFPSPFLLAPIGVLELAHPKADLAVAGACASTGIPMIFSNQASIAMEECSTILGDSPCWFQLYWSKSNELVQSFVSRAEACGCHAIVVTLDTTMLGWRSKDIDLAYLPFLKGMGIAQYTSDPVFKQLLKSESDNEDQSKRKINLAAIKAFIDMNRTYPGNFWKNLRSKEPLAAIRQFIQIYSRPSLTWENLSFLREHTKLPILLKGILHPEDAWKAVDHGADGIIVSNHGGRQVDGAIGALDALNNVIDVVNDKIPVLMDSGIRSGADAFKALAIGAKAVCLGRPYVYALALAGEKGVYELLRNIMADFELTMGLAGCRNVHEINKKSISRNS
ncbi:lactate 2-monooxygenase [Fulvivirgaceae bacterium BMA10]|uniref:Lactate 2-monooxygenase n=1 Tax=Splendidivirga corallicola TaxID=3051826 RepID=A0ABT8KNF0_9BACT|nr:lactate 2-monooxygenase [Fulvivirgaceae bacterium BMA10]